MNAREWLARNAAATPDIALLGVPVSRLSISASEAWSTPPAFRAALQRFPTWNAEHEVDVATLAVRDHGDVDGDRDDADVDAVRGRIGAAAERCVTACALSVFVGGDNSLTVPAMRGAIAARPQHTWGLVTFDAHHDCRPLDDGPRNGTPVRELIGAGDVVGARVVQVGIHPLANAAEHARWAREQGVTVFPMHDVRSRGAGAVVDDALRHLRAQDVTAIYADVDIDCVDRAFAPACPASLPGGMSPEELMQAVHGVARDPRVLAMDLTEMDANADVAGSTLRLAAATFLTAIAGFAQRSGAGARR